MLEMTTNREVQLDFTPEIDVFYTLFDRCHTRNRKRSLKQNKEYFNFRSKIQLDHPVQGYSTWVQSYLSG